MPECGNPAKPEEPAANNVPHEIRIACDTDTFELFTLAKARLIPHLRTEPSNQVALRVLAELFLKDDSQNRVGTMLTRMRIKVPTCDDFRPNRGHQGTHMVRSTRRQYASSPRCMADIPDIWEIWGIGDSVDANGEDDSRKSLVGRRAGLCNRAPSRPSWLQNPAGVVQQETFHLVFVAPNSFARIICTRPRENSTR